jgi:hypothetical protein
VADKKQYVSRVRLIDGTTVDIKDQEARLILESLFTDTIILDCGTYTDDTDVTIEE